MHKLSMRFRAVAGAAVLAATGATAVAVTGTSAEAATTRTSFQMVRAGGVVARGCLAGAHAKVTIVSQGQDEVMKVSAVGLPPDTTFDLFVIQVPNAPFGISLYTGDLVSDSTGHADGRFIGRFGIETFAVAPGVAQAPPFSTAPGSIPDATTNPAFNPVQLYHLGLWFNSPKDAAAACGVNTVTAFNGEHDAGIQALNTSNFPDQSGPLSQAGS